MCIHEACKSWSIHYGAQDWLSDHSLQSGVAVEFFARVLRKALLALGWLEIAQRLADGCMLLRFILRHVP